MIPFASVVILQTRKSLADSIAFRPTPNGSDSVYGEWSCYFTFTSFDYI